MLNKPKCILFKMDPPPDEAVIRKIAETIPWALNCIDCARRKEGKLEKICWKDMTTSEG
jgi:hypothetical protein